ncbi:MAG: hypothetical protein LBG74_00310, partial [Spirochaetaceae bacterium]|nr:hypothetical protein [Spirochaetaceae bacterium]
MAKPHGVDAYKNILKGKKNISQEDSDWLEKVARANQELAMPENWGGGAGAAGRAPPPPPPPPGDNTKQQPTKA